jgi:hypothetical protein
MLGRPTDRFIHAATLVARRGDLTGVGVQSVQPAFAERVVEVSGLVAKGRPIRLWIALRRALILFVV